MLPFHTCDVFTCTPFAGNPLAIVLEADGLSTPQMQMMAREFNLSETIFVRTPANPAHTAEVRIFFPTAEIPFAGHPTIGCAIFLAQQQHGDADFSTLITLEEQAGLVPVNVTRKTGVTTAQFTAPVIPHRPTAAPDTDKLTPLAAQALDLAIGDIGFAGHTVGGWSGGPTFLYVPVASLTALSSARPLEPQWSALMQAAGVDSAYLYTANGPGGYRARMFSPTAGIPEDPATGSASAILSAQLLHAGVLTEGTTDITLAQGVEMGRPSDISLSVEVTDQAIAAVRIAGQSVAISSGHIRVPDPAQH